MSTPNTGIKERVAVGKVLRSGQLSMGPKTLEFERDLASFRGLNCGVVAVNSGTSALHLGLLCMNLHSTDEVIVPAFTFAATANAVRMAGAKPVFADVDIGTMNLSRETVAPLIGRSTKAVIFVSLFGNMSGIEEIYDLCREKGVALVEDAAQSFGSKSNEIVSGGIADWSAFSFYPTKNITTGEGGAVTSRDDELLTGVRLLRNQGMSKQYENEIPGLNNRMTDLQAAIGIEQLKRAERFLRIRREIAAHYSDVLESLEPLSHQTESPGVESSYNQFTLRIPVRRELFRLKLMEAGIQSRVYYPTPVSALAPYRDLNVEHPVATQLSKEVLSIPIHPKMTNRQIRYVGEKLKQTSQLLS